MVKWHFFAPVIFFQTLLASLKGLVTFLDCKGAGNHPPLLLLLLLLLLVCIPESLDQQ